MVYDVFNVQQVEGLPPRFYSRIGRPIKQRTREIEKFINNTKATFRTTLGDPTYMKRGGTILLPPDAMFRDREAYYATVMRMLFLWAGRRLKWNFAEEHAEASRSLIAEIGGAFLCAGMGISAAPEIDVLMIQRCLAFLQADKRALAVASNMAQSAVDHLYALQPKKDS